MGWWWPAQDRKRAGPRIHTPAARPDVLALKSRSHETRRARLPRSEACRRQRSGQRRDGPCESCTTPSGRVRDQLRPGIRKASDPKEKIPNCFWSFYCTLKADSSTDRAPRAPTRSVGTYQLYHVHELYSTDHVLTMSGAGTTWLTSLDIDLANGAPYRTAIRRVQRSPSATSAETDCATTRRLARLQPPSA